MTKKMRGFTKDGWVRVQRTVLRRVVGDRLHALLRGDFTARNKLGEDDYDPIVNEVAALSVPPPPPPAAHNGGAGENGGPSPPPLPQAPASNEYSPKLEKFVEIIAASIMIDASMRGENAGESDTRFIKKKKKLLARTLQGPKLGDFQKEVVRFDKLRKGEEYEEEELAESEESDEDSSEGSDGEDELEQQEEIEKQKNSKNKKPHHHHHHHHHHGGHANIPQPPPQQHQQQLPSGGEQSSSDEEGGSTISGSGDATSSLSRSGGEDGFSTSASQPSSKHQLKKERKREKKRRKKEKKRLKKEKKRREKEEKKKAKKRKAEKERMKQQAAAAEGGGKKRKKHHHHEVVGGDEVIADLDQSTLKDLERRSSAKAKATAHAADDASESVAESAAASSSAANNDDNGGADDDEAPVYEIATRGDFERYRSDLLSRVPSSVKSRFREGGFSRWGKDWLPVLEIGPFDVEPGPVREMWLDMLDNTQENGRDMTRLVFWYGVKFEDRGQAYSFVPEAKIIPYEEGHSKGYCKMPKKIQNKIEKQQKLTKTEEQIKRGLSEIEADMQRDKSERLAWMMKFKEHYELAQEEAARAAAKKKAKDGEAKRKPGRPKKVDGGEVKRKPGRPKKVVEGDGDGVVKKRKPGRPKKSDKDKANKKKSTAKKWVVVDEDQESDMETEDDEADRDYDESDSDSDDDEIDGDYDSEDGPKEPKKRKAPSSSSDKKSKKARPAMTEEEKAVERRAKAAEYREKKAREKAEAQGLEYVKGRVGRKSKQTMLEEEQMKFTKCEEVFMPLMERLTEAKDASNVKSVLKCINAIMERVEILTPPFLREYPLGMLVKTVRKAFEGAHPEVKDRCKRLTNEMKRVFAEKEKKMPDGFDPIKNKKSTPKVKARREADSAASSAVPETVKMERAASKSEKADILVEQSSIPKTNSAISLPEHTATDTSKSEPTQPKQKKTFSIKGMFEKPKPTPKPKISAPVPNSVVSSSQPSPKPKSLPSWVTGPASKMEDFHEEYAKERTFGQEFLFDAASLVPESSTKFDPVSVSQSFELAIFAATKLRGRDWQQYWEKVHDVVAMLSPGKDERNAILQGIIDGDYQDPNELVKLSRREIQSLNGLKG